MTNSESAAHVSRAETIRRALRVNISAAEHEEVLAALDSLLADREQATVALQTCLHLLGEEGYIADPDYPEVAEALALYERLVGA